MPSDAERIAWDNGFWAGQVSRDSEVAELRAELARLRAEVESARDAIHQEMLKYPHNDRSLHGGIWEGLDRAAGFLSEVRTETPSAQ
jgi:hypothetical protein